MHGSGPARVIQMDACWLRRVADYDAEEVAVAMEAFATDSAQPDTANEIEQAFAAHQAPERRAA